VNVHCKNRWGLPSSPVRCATAISLGHSVARVEISALTKVPGSGQLNKHHTSNGSVSVVRTTFKVYGKMQTLTLSQPKTPEPIVTKF